MKKTIIGGCESRGDADSPYLIRYTFFECKYFKIALHVFLRSDNEEHHDHPWNFLSIILWRGYYEETVVWPKCPKHKTDMELLGDYFCWECYKKYAKGDRHSYEMVAYNHEPRKQKRVWPGMFLFRKATHPHRVVLIDEKPAVTLVIMGKRVRAWGFFTNQGWKVWTKYFIDNKC